MQGKLVQEVLSALVVVRKLVLLLGFVVVVVKMVAHGLAFLVVRLSA
jgi:hypothetical protein